MEELKLILHHLVI